MYEYEIEVDGERIPCHASDWIDACEEAAGYAEEFGVVILRTADLEIEVRA